MTARIIRLPRTPGGRALLRDVAIYLGGWGKPGGVELEAFDWDGEAELNKQQGVPPMKSTPRRGR